MENNVQKARDAGYSDDEIADYLGGIHKFNVQKAIDSGYGADEIIDLLSSRPLAKDSSEKNFPEMRPGSTSPITTIGERGLQGLTYGWADELYNRGGAAYASAVEDPYGVLKRAAEAGDTGPVGLSKALFSGEKYEEGVREATGRTQARIKAQGEETPKTALLSELGGGVLGTVAAAGSNAGKEVLSRIWSGGLPSRIGKGILAGATSGAVSGAGSADSGEAAEGAVSGAGVGAAIGAGVPVVSKVAGKVLSPITKTIADSLTRKVAISSGELPKQEPISKALEKVSDRLRAEYPDEESFKKALAQYFVAKDKSLIEVGGKRLENLAEGAAQYPTGASKASEFFENAVSNVPEKLKSSAAKSISKNNGYYDRLDEIVSIGRKEAAPFYEKAYAENSAVQSSLIDRILRTPEGKGALDEAVKNLRNEMSLVAKPDPELTKMLGEMVSLGKAQPSKGGVAPGLKLKTLDYVKRAMDSTIDKAYRSGDTAEAKRIGNLKSALVNELDALDKSGSYAKARSISGDYLSNRDAMEAGTQFLREDPEIVNRIYSKFGKTERQSYRAGVIKSIRDNIQNKMDGQNVSSIFKKEATRKKLASILTDKEYKSLMDQAAAADNIYRLRNQITGNSRTMLRNIAAQEFDNETVSKLASAISQGPIGVAKDVARKVIVKMFDGISDKTAGEVADILYETDQKKKYQIIKALVNKSNSEGQALRGTDAAKKLSTFYKISDVLSRRASE